MLSLVQLLSLAADAPSDPLSTNQSQQDLQEMSQNFISVADSLISEDNAFKWQSIREVGAQHTAHGSTQLLGPPRQSSPEEHVAPRDQLHRQEKVCGGSGRVQLGGDRGQCAPADPGGMNSLLLFQL